MNYLSFFSGIGTFEHAIHERFPESRCLGFSEIDSDALYVYQAHFPQHPSLGDINKITELQIRKILTRAPCHVIVGGFPCQDLSSLSRAFGHENYDGLDGARSGLFFKLKKILKWITKHNRVRAKIIIENNGSMTLANQERITKLLKQIDSRIEPHLINSNDFGLQRRRRIFWTNFELAQHSVIQRKQTWKNVLLHQSKVKNLYVGPQHYIRFNKTYSVTNSDFIPVSAVQTSGHWYMFKDVKPKGNRSRWQMGTHSDTRNSFTLPISRTNNFLIVRRSNGALFRVRKFHPIELERLFFLPDGYVSAHFSSLKRCERLLGNAIVVEVIDYILNNLVPENGFF